MKKKTNKILTISEQLKKNYKGMNISVLKGPCLAKELAMKNQTSVVIANKDIKIAKLIGKQISTRYYLAEYSKDVIGIEVCSAIKNIYAMIIGAGQSLNSSSNLFQKSILEMKYLIKYFKGNDDTILGLAGVGDLYVSAAGGRNSKMGSYLGKGFTFQTAKKRFMPKDTVEGEQLAREIAPFILKKINRSKIPLMINLIKTILGNKKLKIKV
jgi:glycerol-3-phosphate dehydrogenase (NAD(P)+)